jgi:hypothetical protein
MANAALSFGQHGLRANGHQPVTIIEPAQQRLATRVSEL